MRKVSTLSLAFVFSLLGMAQIALASFPQLEIILPRGVQRGGERELVFQGARLADTEEILFHSAVGFEVKKIEVVNENSIKALVLVPETCPLGEHLVQLRTKSGISDYKSFMVGALPIVEEKEQNGSLAEAQPIELNVTVHGVCDNEDVDHYMVQATKGQRISVDIEALRLGSYLFDPYIAILDEKRFELAAVDDAPIAQQDGVLSVLAPEDGKYFIQVRETSYGGNGACRYRLHVGTFPRPTAVFPAGGKISEVVSVNFLRDATGSIPYQVTVPSTGSTLNLFPQDANGICPSAIPFRVSEYGNGFEQEPNNEIAQGTLLDATLSFNGIIEGNGDIDCFKFAAKAGQVFDIECFARRLRSGLDPVMNIYYADGRGITGNDDSRGPDSYFRFQAPADGEYVIRVTDHLGRGQSDFVYRVELQSIKPSLSISIPRIDRYSQTRQTIFVAKGNRFATLINASRNNFGGELILDGSQLPAGITMVAQPMNANLAQMPVVFEAAADAPLSGKLIEFTARHADANTGIVGHFENNADFVLGPPNNAVYYNGHVEKLAVAVIDTLPYQLEIVQPQAPLVQNGTMNLKVIAKRAEGFTEAINVEFPFRSPGIGAGPSVQIPAGQNEVIYQLNAAGNATVGKWPVYCLGQANVNGPAWVASQLATLEVTDPYTTATLARSSCEQGQVGQIVCTLTQVKPFEGEAIARLQGLPPNTSAPELKFTKDTTELVFEVKTDATSPVGNHKTTFVELQIPINNEPVVMRGGGTEFQIDAPIVKTAPPMPMPMPMPMAQPAPMPEAPKEKPLTRLEKLRLQAKQAKEAEGKK